MGKFSIPSIALIALVACNDNANNAEQQSATTQDSTEYKVQIPNSSCYLYTSGRDTVALKVEVFPNVVTGVLQYDFFEKDGSKGELEGKLQGDTLVAEYNFMAEGTKSTRQVFFLLKDSMAIEGYGDVEEKNGKIVFKNTSQVDFGKGMKLHKISCQEYDPAQSSQPVPAQASSGSEVFYMYQWNLVELQGRPIEKNEARSPAYLSFSPGKVNAVAGNTGCNRLKGTFDLTGTNNIKFSPLITTKMACPGNITETAFLGALSKATTWQIVNNQLSLSDGNTTLAKFNGVSPDAKPASGK